MAIDKCTWDERPSLGRGYGVLGQTFLVFSPFSLCFLFTFPLWDDDHHEKGSQVHPKIMPTCRAHAGSGSESQVIEVGDLVVAPCMAGLMNGPYLLEGLSAGAPTSHFALAFYLFYLLVLCDYNLKLLLLNNVYFWVLAG